MSKKESKDYDIAIEMAQDSLIQIEGEAAAQIIQAYKGVRYDSQGKDLNHKGRSLKQIKDYKLNPQYTEKNVKQQAGFSAELIEEARKNKENIRSGKNERIRTTDGIGMTNDTHYDHVKVDVNGQVVDGSGSQMKIYGITQKGGKDVYRVIEKIVKDDSWDRYDTVIDIPKEQYDDAKEYASNQAAKLREQAESFKKKNNLAQAQKLEMQAEKYDQAAKRIRKSDVTTDEAITARLNPEKFVNKEIIRDVNNAGIESATGAAMFSSSISIAQNLYAVGCNEKNLDEAARDVLKDTAKAGAIGYGVGASGTAIKAMMHSSKSEFIRRCGTTSLPTIIATSVVETSKSFKRYANNEINEIELVEELGQKGIGMVASGYGAAVGAVVGGSIGSIIPVLGTATGALIGQFMGSMVAYSTSAILYEGALCVLKMSELSERRRRVIERMAKEAIEENKKQIGYLNNYLRDSQEKYRTEVCSIIDLMNKSIIDNDIGLYVDSIEQFCGCFGIDLEYKTFDEFDLAMDKDEAIAF